MASLIPGFAQMRVSDFFHVEFTPDKDSQLEKLLDQAKKLMQGDSCKEKVKIGENQEGKPRIFSFIIGNRKNGPFAIPYSEKKQSPWKGILSPIEIGKGTHNRALKATEFSNAGERHVAILKSQKKDEKDEKDKKYRKRFEETAAILDLLHSEGELEYVEKKGFLPRCARGVRITELFETDLFKLEKKYRAPEMAALVGKVLQGIIGSVSKEYYPMDIKLENILVTGDELAICDLGQGYLITTEKKTWIAHTHWYCSEGMGEVGRMIAGGAPKNQITHSLEKELVFQVAIALLGLHHRRFSENQLFFKTVESDGWKRFGYKNPFAYLSFLEENKGELEGYLTKCRYSEEQVDRILSALQNEPNERPSLKEMAIAFPVTAPQ